MANNNKLIVAAAGSGKTTLLIKEALKNSKNSLITTYTEANDNEIKSKIVEINKFIPSNIVVKTWYSFLLQHGVRPYQDFLFKAEIKGLNLTSKQSAQFVPETDVRNHYFDSNQKIYSDKISKFLIKCNEKSNGKVISRLSRIFENIFIDEVQDLAGYDLDFLRLLFGSKISTLLVGDPRQGTFSTSSSSKNKKFKRSAIVSFFDDKNINIEKDDALLNKNYRSITEICELSDELFPNYPKTESKNEKKTEHDGIYLVRKKDLCKYMSEYNPMQLRDSRRTKVENDFSNMNFGESKGLTFDRVLIYPTGPIKKWLADHKNELPPTSRCKFYVAMTRAKFSVAFVYDFKDGEEINGMNKYV